MTTAGGTVDGLDGADIDAFGDDADRPDDVAGMSLRLDPDSSAARRARGWVVRVLADWPEDALERARLLVSELVTNAVLHARTPITVRCRRDGDRVLFEVGDGHSSGPMPKRFVADSPTGRGMRLVAALAGSWGVERTENGKIVWFTLTREMQAPPPGVFEAGVVVDPGVLAAAVGEPAVASTGAHQPATISVRILRLPIDVYLEAEQHNDAVLRELDLVERSSRRGPQVPPRLLELASALRAVFSSATTSTRAQVEEALRNGLERVDLEIEVPAEGWQVLSELAVQLDEVDRFCEEATLLTLAASPRMRFFRHWYANQVASQARGEPPAPWPDGATG